MAEARPAAELAAETPAAWNPAAAPDRLEGAPFDTLLETFRSFNVLSEQVRDSYERLQERVRRLDLELAEKNLALEANLQEIERVKNHLSHILSSLSAGVMVVDLAGDVTAFNPAAETITGRTQEEARRTGYPQILQLDGRENATLPEFPCKARQEIRLRGRRGEVRDVAVSVSPLRGSGDAVLGTVVILEDITTLKELEEENERSRRLAAMGEMAASIVHEIRNPLGGIELMTSLLVEELPPDEEPGELACQILAGVRSLHHVLANLSLFNRDLKPNPTGTDLHAFLEEGLKFAAELVRRQGVEVRRAYASPAPRVRFDPELFNQVILNLVINALQSMPAGGRIGVETEAVPPGERGDGLVRIVISDTGRGFSPEVGERMFSPFYTTKPRGTGLGLSIVHKIVSAHGGEVAGESRPGEGSRFTIALPWDGALVEEGAPPAGGLLVSSVQRGSRP
ncbi:MAG: nitrogen regulation protein NR(II) [Nitrospinota bacterium]